MASIHYKKLWLNSLYLYVELLTIRFINLNIIMGGKPSVPESVKAMST